MHPDYNSQFTAEERTEAFRTEIAQLQLRQTKALESIRGMLTFIVALICLGLVLGIFASIATSRGGL
ncbi:MAG: hypothetical protein JWO98_2612 [Frankiales bacterium]|nr:hypothetical protein [Frankiales bacterium]